MKVFGEHNFSYVMLYCAFYDNKKTIMDFADNGVHDVIPSVLTYIT